jgi:cytochrome c oxidase assembly protein subunit 15
MTSEVLSGRMATAAGAERRIGWWLVVCAALVFVMVLLGGVTRLTESGLSIVEWKPVTGILPPVSDHDWQQEFDKYRQFPEYQKVKRDLSLDAFKRIWWMEYSHRLFGRAIGVVFLVPFLWFLTRRELPAGLHGPLWLLFLLGAAQGAVGWFMVKSGLVDRPDVSQIRLALHLGLALAIYLGMLWLAFGLLWPPARRGGGLAWVVLSAALLQAMLGALVAGLDAGQHYNTFPLMDGQWLPPGLDALAPWWRNLVDNPITVQFQHRLGAYGLTALALWLWARGASQARHWLLVALALQLALGILTLVYVVPIPLAAAHQAGAVLLLTAALAVARGY